MKMKKLIYAAAFTLAITSLAQAGWADGSVPDAKVPHFTHSGAHPNNARLQGSTHHFEVHVQGKALSQLSIDLPEDVSISRGIEVTDQSGQEVAAEVSINDRKATVAFSQPVAPDTTLSVKMRGITTPGYPETWLYQVYAKLVDVNAEIPLGSARIQTNR
jgi:hypothetical protein